MRDTGEHTSGPDEEYDAWVDDGDGDTLDLLVYLGISISIDNGSEWMVDLLEHGRNTLGLLCVGRVSPSWPLTIQASLYHI